MKTCLKCRNTIATDLTADLGTLLAYYKLKDTFADEGFVKKLSAFAAYPFLSAARKRAQKRCPEADAAIAAMSEAQAQAEHAKTDSIDRAAEPFATMLSTLATMAAQDEKQHVILARFGYCLGRWVYLIDAVDDIADDLKHHRYNPYALSRGLTADNTDGIKVCRDYAALTLNACLAECIAAYNLLDVRRFDGIIRNILEQGMPAVQRRVILGEEQNHESRSV